MCGATGGCGWLRCVPTPSQASTTLTHCRSLVQAPNFVLACPTATLAAAAVVAYCHRRPLHVATGGGLLPVSCLARLFRLQRTPHAPPSGIFVNDAFVYIAHLAAMTLFGLLFMHVQVRPSSFMKLDRLSLWQCLQLSNLMTPSKA
jgi:hypothetical protein